MVKKDQHIKLIANHIDTDKTGYVSVYFDRPISFDFEAGDWIDIQFEGRQLNGGITYSLSSSPTESELRITFHEGISEFKRALQVIKPGEQLYISQYGNDYGFQLKKNQSSVLIAGGVGIAPFRSMLKQMYDNNDQNDVRLIYLNKDDDFLFKEEFDQWSSRLPKISIVYISTNKINRKMREKMILSVIGDINQNFYISGPPSMVESTEHLLIGRGVQVRDIRIDSFGGY